MSGNVLPLQKRPPRGTLTLVGKDSDMLDAAEASSGLTCVKVVSDHVELSKICTDSFAFIDDFLEHRWVDDQLRENPRWNEAEYRQGSSSNRVFLKTPLPSTPNSLSVSIVVNLSKGSADGISCVEAIKARTFYPYRNIVITCDSSDDFVYSNIKVLEDRRDIVEEIGGSVSELDRMIVGVSAAFSKGADYVCVVDDRCLVTEGWLTRLVQCQYLTESSAVAPLMNESLGMSLPMGLAPKCGAHNLFGPHSYIGVAKGLSTMNPDFPPLTMMSGDCVMFTSDAWVENGFSVGETNKLTAMASMWASIRESGGRCLVADHAYVYKRNDPKTARISGRLRSGLASMYPDLVSSDKRWNAATSTNRHRSHIASVRSSSIPVAMTMTSIGHWGGIIAPLRICQELNELGFDASAAYLRTSGENSMPREWCLPFSPRRFNDMASLEDWKTYMGWDTGFVISSHVFSAIITSSVRTACPGVSTVSFWQDREDLFEGKERDVKMTGDHMDLFASSDLHVFNSKWVCQSALSDFSGIGKHSTIPVGVDTSKFRPRHRKSNQKLRIIAMWRPHTSRRGHEDLMSLYRKIRSEYGNTVSLEVYGEKSPGHEVHSLIDCHHGWLNRRELSQVIPSCDIVVEPSKFQGFGMPGLEAMSSGCALVSTDNMGVHEYGVHGKNCLIGGSVESLYMHTVRLIEDRFAREAISYQARKSSLDFDWSTVGARWGMFLLSAEKDFGRVGIESSKRIFEKISIQREKWSGPSD